MADTLRSLKSACAFFWLYLLASSRKRSWRTYGEIEYEAQWDDRQLCRCLYASSWRFCRVQLWIYLTSNQRIVVPPSVPNACRHKNVAMWSTHNKPDDLDGVNPKICLSSIQERLISGPKACQSIWHYTWQGENNQKFKVEHVGVAPDSSKYVAR